MMAPGGGAALGAGVGLRMTGKYSDGRLLLDFGGNSLVIDCGQAHVRQPYTVDNSLRGAGSTTVNGRLVTGMNGDDVAFAQHSETCDVGTFRPNTGATPATSVATSAATPARNGRG